MNTDYLKTLSQSIVTKAVNNVICRLEDEKCSFEEISIENLDDLGFDGLDLVELIMDIESIACVTMDDSFFGLNVSDPDDENEAEFDFNTKITFGEIADYLYSLMYSSING